MRDGRRGAVVRRRVESGETGGGRLRALDLRSDLGIAPYGREGREGMGGG